MLCRFALALALATIACGPPPADFAGTWVGTTTLTNQCDGDPAPDMLIGTQTFVFVQNGSSLQVKRESCTSLPLDIDGDSAELSGSHVCPKRTDSRGNWVTTWTSFTLLMQDGSVNLSNSTTTDNEDLDGTRYKCTATEFGLLSRQ